MRIVLTQPYVAAYRVPLFEAIRARFSALGHDFTVAAGVPDPEQAARGDSVSLNWIHNMPSGHSNGVGVSNAWRKLPAELMGADALVTELDVKNRLAWSRRTHRARHVVLWGHGKPYVSAHNALRERVKRHIASRADAVMTYTDGGRQYLVHELGLEPTRVTAIGNAIDTTSLLTGRDDAVRSGARDRALAVHGRGPHYLYVGGLDASKRVPFLAEAARELRALSPASRLFVCGDGAERHIVEDAAAQGDVVYLGKVGRRQVGEVAAICSGVWMPGRVGLVALDAQALGLRVFTTHGGQHAPEIEYLSADELAYLPDQPRAFAEASIKISAMRIPQSAAPTGPTIQSVAHAFVDVILNTCDV